MHVSLPLVTLCYSLCGWAGAEGFPLPAAVSAGMPFHRRAGYCMADVRGRPSMAYSPTTFFFWTSCGKEKKGNWIGGCPTHPPKWHFKGFQCWLLFLFGAGSEGKKVREIGKNLGGCVSPASTDKSVVVLQNNSDMTAQIRMRTVSSLGEFRHTDIVNNLAGFG